MIWLDESSGSYAIWQAGDKGYLRVNYVGTEDPKSPRASDEKAWPNCTRSLITFYLFVGREFTPSFSLLSTILHSTIRFPDSGLQSAGRSHIPGVIISSGLINLSKSSALTRSSATAASLRVVPSAWAFLAILAALS